MVKAIIVSKFDAKDLRAKPKVLHKLAEIYCNIFSMDSNFGEYRQCPVCKTYYNYQQVEVEGTHFCDKGHSKVKLVLAWEVKKVEVEIMEQASEPGFLGALAFLHGELAGFGWARVISFTEVSKHWGGKISDQVLSKAKTPKLVYFDELGVDPEIRNKGLGKALVEYICRRAKQKHPEDMALLRTHKNSRARVIFESVGYVIFAEDTEYGGGRVMMKADRCADLTVVA